jgi:ribosomal protein S20
MEYDTPSFLYLIKSMPGVIIENPVGLTFDSERDLGGTDYIIYRGTALAAGETVSVQFTGLVSWTDALMRNQIVWAGGLLIAPVALLVYFFVLKKDGGSKEPEQPQATFIRKASDSLESEDEPPTADESSIEDLEAERKALISVLEKIEEDYHKGEIPKDAYRSLKSRYRDNLEEIEAELGTSQPDEEQEDLKAEESALRSVLEKIASDHDKGLLSKRAYNRLKDRYEERLDEIREMLR